jgi:hypothetical protein
MEGPHLSCALRVDIYMPETTDTTDFYLQVVCLDYNSISILDYNSIFISNMRWPGGRLLASSFP